ncbi:unnamed protein product [Rotaria sordida]|uniref:NAD(P)(+)--arginine ADP-ribosyltransferase n=1 Tax=Rotaria sordida TaxID=392033 RepID=A0A816B5E5_9BILA|nr:unnamed protein product [Rotaria sordida]CAF1605772.1 unnamed protein product [Rotaria sordida]
MAEGGGSSRRDGKRYTDLSNEPDKPLPPLQKFTNQPVPQLQDAVKSIHNALQKLPSVQDRVWRGINGNIVGQYKANSVHVWWGASSCSDQVHVTETFLDKKSDRTLFSIKCYEGKIIKNHSAFPNESEIVLPPGTCLRVKSLSNIAAKVHIIDMEQIPYEEPSPEIAPTSSASTDEHHVYLIWLDGFVNKSKDNIETQEQLRQLNNNFKSFEKPDRCESFINQSTNHSRIIIIVGGQIGRQFVPKVHDYAHLKTIFVFCMNKVENEKWVKNHDKVTSLFFSATELF